MGRGSKTIPRQSSPNIMSVRRHAGTKVARGVDLACSCFFPVRGVTAVMACIPRPSLSPVRGIYTANRGRSSDGLT
jgi:hypothetical protein